MEIENRQRLIGSLIVLGLVFGAGVGCSSTPEESDTSRSIQDVRGDSDRFFQKMEKEEKNK